MSDRSLVFAAADPVCVPDTHGRAFPVRRIYCVGRNYADHAIEMGGTGREAPFFFMKPADALLVVPEGQTGGMHYPGLTSELHHEVELVVAIGRGGRRIAAGDALDHVWGYAVGLDMTRRDLQAAMKKSGRPWEIAKAFDESAPIGPITPISACGELTSGAITLSVNGELRQRGDLSDLIWSVRETIAAISHAWTLQAGDLIFSGTPAGVAAVVAGDRLHAEIAGLPALDVTVLPAE